MAELTLLEEIKIMLGVTGNYHDASLQLHIDDVKGYLIDGGVDESVVESKSSVGVIKRGVADLWNYGAGDGVLSSYFKERAIQLASRKVEKPDPEVV